MEIVVLLYQLSQKIRFPRCSQHKRELFKYYRTSIAIITLISQVYSLPCQVVLITQVVWSMLILIQTMEVTHLYIYNNVQHCRQNRVEAAVIAWLYKAWKAEHYCIKILNILQVISKYKNSRYRHRIERTVLLKIS